MNRLKMAQRLRRLATSLEEPVEPVEPHIKQVQVILTGYDKEGESAILAQFYVLPNVVFSTGRIPNSLATENISIMVRPL